MTKRISLIHSTKLVEKNLEVGNEEGPVFTKGVYKGKKYVANLDSGYLKNILKVGDADKSVKNAFEQLRCKKCGQPN